VKSAFACDVVLMMTVIVATITIGKELKPSDFLCIGCKNTIPVCAFTTAFFEY
jgi:hypothetical protein